MLLNISHLKYHARTSENSVAELAVLRFSDFREQVEPIIMIAIRRRLGVLFGQKDGRCTKRLSLVQFHM